MIPNPQPLDPKPHTLHPTPCTLDVVADETKPVLSSIAPNPKP